MQKTRVLIVEDDQDIAGLIKHTLERETIRYLQREGMVDFKNSTTLLVSAVDRFGMAQALVEQLTIVTVDPCGALDPAAGS